MIFFCNMAKQEYFELGQINKPHGVKGGMHVHLDVDDPLLYEDLDAVFVQENGELVPYFIEDLQIRSNIQLMQLEGINDLDAAKAMVGAKLFLPVEVLPDLGENKFYFHEIIGFQVVDAKEGDLGLVKEVISLGAQEVISMTYQHKEVLIPLSDAIVSRVDKTQKIVHTDLPDGLLAVYLEDAH